VAARALAANEASKVMATVQVADITKLVIAAQGRIDMVVRKITLDLYTKVIMATPVDTGRARGGWTASTGQPDLTDTQHADRSGAATVSNMTGRLSSTPVIGMKIYLTNNVGYIRYLEYGSSMQAPQGMVRIAATQFASVLRAANQALP
jgi:hypothetical protein